MLGIKLRFFGRVVGVIKFWVIIVIFRFNVVLYYLIIIYDGRWNKIFVKYVYKGV